MEAIRACIYPDERRQVDSWLQIGVRSLTSDRKYCSRLTVTSLTDPAETLPLGRRAFELHAQYAKELDGAQHWGYRPLTTFSANFNMVPTKSPKKPKSIRGAPWLNPDCMTKTTQLGNTSTTAQVTPRLFTNRLVEVS